MKNMLLIFIGGIFCILLNSPCVICAEKGSSDVNWKEKIGSNRQMLREQQRLIKQSAKEDRAKEKELRQQIQDAVKAGDMEKADKLREEFRAVHQKNIQEMQQDRKKMRGIQEELQEAKKKALLERYDANKDGVVSKEERRLKRDNKAPVQNKEIKTEPKSTENNSPGAKAGPGPGFNYMGIWGKRK